MDMAENNRFEAALSDVDAVVDDVASRFEGRLAEPATVAEFTGKVARAIRHVYGPLGAPATEDVVRRFQHCHIRPAAYDGVLQRLSEAEEKCASDEAEA